MAWFGPMFGIQSGDDPSTTFLDRIVALLKFGWFFGDIDKEQSEVLLRDFRKKPGTFLVRVNLGGNVEPNTSPFTISKVNKNKEIEHVRVYHTKDRSGYFMQIKTKNGDRQVFSRGGLNKLIKKLKQKGILRTGGGVPGQKYKVIFEEEEAISKYVEADKEQGSTPSDNSDGNEPSISGGVGDSCSS